MLNLKQFIFDLRTFVASSALPRLRTFWGTFGHFKGPGSASAACSTGLNDSPQTLSHLTQDNSFEGKSRNPSFVLVGHLMDNLFHRFVNFWHLVSAGLCCPEVLVYAIWVPQHPVLLVCFPKKMWTSLNFS